MGCLIPAQLGMAVHIFRLINLNFFASRKDQRIELISRLVLQLSRKSYWNILACAKHSCKLCSRKVLKIREQVFVGRCCYCFLLFPDLARRQNQRITTPSPFVNVRIPHRFLSSPLLERVSSLFKKLTRSYILPKPWRRRI